MQSTIIRKKMNRAILINAVLFGLLVASTSRSQNVAVTPADSLAVHHAAKHLADTLEIINLGAHINSELSEYTPRISTDGKTLYFCRKTRSIEADSTFRSHFSMSWNDFVQLSETERKQRLERVFSRMNVTERIFFFLMLKYLEGQEDIFVSHFVDGQWSSAVNMGAPLNADLSHDAPQSISADNNQIFVFRNANIFTAELLGTSWSQPEKVEDPINSECWDGDICFSSDGMTLIFVSDRPGFTASKTDTAANKDIWVTIKKAGNWTEPLNLGPAINTPKEERTPFLHADGKTLYFASSGHQGEGDLDIFKTTRLNDSSWTEWSEPVNLARLNTPGSDWDLTIPANGEWGYFSSEKEGGFGTNDIYKFRVDSTILPARSVTLIAGVVTSTNGEPLAAEIRWENLDTGELLGTATSNKVTGEYTIALPAGRRYGYYATKENFWDKSDNIDITNLQNYKELIIDIQLVPIQAVQAKKNETDAAWPEIVLRNIFFDFNSAVLKEASNSELNRLAQKLKNHSEIRIEIQGHTDSLGTEKYNLDLSQKRAGAVRSYLASAGITPVRLTAVGYGEDLPVDTNSTDAGRQNNRRVSFVVIRNFSEK